MRNEQKDQLNNVVLTNKKLLIHLLITTAVNGNNHVIKMLNYILSDG